MNTMTYPRISADPARALEVWAALRGYSVRLELCGVQVDDDGWTHHAWRCDIIRHDETSAVVVTDVPYCTGMGIALGDVRPGHVLASLLSDAGPIERGESKWDTFDDFGMDADRARRWDEEDWPAMIRHHDIVWRIFGAGLDTAMEIAHEL